MCTCRHVRVFVHSCICVYICTCIWRPDDKLSYSFRDEVLLVLPCEIGLYVGLFRSLNRIVYIKCYYIKHLTKAVNNNVTVNISSHCCFRGWEGIGTVRSLLVFLQDLRNKDKPFLNWMLYIVSFWEILSHSSLLWIPACFFLSPR